MVWNKKSLINNSRDLHLNSVYTSQPVNIKGIFGQDPFKSNFRYIKHHFTLAFSVMMNSYRIRFDSAFNNEIFILLLTSAYEFNVVLHPCRTTV